MDDRRIRLARSLGIAFVAAGFIAIGLGWNGSAKVACPDCQLPYLLSGGAAGLGLIVFGSVLLILAHISDERGRLAREIARVRDAAVATTAVAAATAGGQEHRADGHGTVVAGGSTFHLPECRLVRERTNLPTMTMDVARAQGLIPCRVCKPEDAETPTIVR